MLAVPKDSAKTFLLMTLELTSIFFIPSFLLEDFFFEAFFAIFAKTLSPEARGNNLPHKDHTLLHYLIIAKIRPNRILNGFFPGFSKPYGAIKVKWVKRPASNHDFGKFQH